MRFFSFLKFFWLPILILLVNELLLNPLQLFLRFWWLDEFLHFFSGAAVALSFVLCLRALRARGLYSAEPWITKVFVVSLVAFVAVGWEWHEFLRDLFLHEHSQTDMFDTMKDLFLGVLGAACAMLFVKD